MARTSWLRRARSGAILAALSCAVALLPGAPAAAVHGLAQRVELTRTADAADVARLLTAIQAVIEVESGDRVQARVPASALPLLRRADRLVRLEPPAVAVPLQVLGTSTLVGADAWLAGGLTGRGVKVAVLDGGFQGYEEALGSTLPAAVTARSFRADGRIQAGTDHGRRAAEIVHGIAPGAELYLLSFSTVTELSAAVDYLVAQRVDIISFSIGYLHNGPGDGTGAVNAIVSRATDRGIAWAAASGNWAQQHWSGPFRDDNRDAVHEFRPGVQQVTRPFNRGDLITLSLRWEDTWGRACADYDLELLSPFGALVRASREVQDCRGNPLETVQVLATETGPYAARIVRGNLESPRHLDLFFVGAPDRGQSISAPVPGGSLGSPADHRSVFSVGALTSALVRAEATYSSRGPTADGRSKPELAAPIGITAAGLETFAGTSASAPHVAAAMALLREAMPGIDPPRMTAELQARGALLPAVQDGTPGLRRLDLSSTAGIGPLLPPGAGEAALVGTLAPGARAAEVRYRGPDGYPLRFLYRLMDGRDVLGAWVFDRQSTRWRGFVAGAPIAVDGVDRLMDGDSLVIVIE